MKLFPRSLLVAASLAFGALLAVPASAETLSTLKIGFQKTGLPVIAQQQKLIEKALPDTKVEWVEFTAGPPLVEALNVGSINIGWVGDAPPIFGQSAGSALVYVAALPPNGLGEAVFVKESSDIKTLADLKGRKVGVGKGTSAHNLLVAALESAGLQFSDIEPVYLSPADAAAAFASDAIDAWSIWDPFFAIAEVRHNPRVLVRSKDVIDVQTYFLANKDFAPKHPEEIRKVIAALAEAAEWANANKDKVAATLHEVTGVPLAAQKLAADRAEFGIGPVTDDIVRGQQVTADRFFNLGLIPNKIDVRDAVFVFPN